MSRDSRLKNRVKVEARTIMDIGPRGGQEDAVLVGTRIYQQASLALDAEDEGEYLTFCVCDGMGGHAAGDICSRFVLDEFNRSFSAQTLSREGIDILLNMIQTAAEGELPLNSGTTIAGVVLTKHQAIVFNAGDSRVYRMRAGELERCSHDHSYVQGLVDKGALSESEAFTHPYRNVVSFGVGSAFSELWGHTAVHYKVFQVQPEDTFILCSDGVTDLIEDQVMETVLGPRPITGVARLRTELKRKTLKDNTTFIIARVVG
ncbi:protein phosphatase 2C domain-containing protein [Desulfoluna sp.]|uniref:PP2C family protein-serine/threonine phosphatase n=1 Tax=Desulfoluna sp. TaxID=2045199 RepID=UPI0026307CBE|nr:protein phosphatase 2C domain-containing protein [Desulfoluna sp.]